MGCVLLYPWINHDNSVLPLSSSRIEPWSWWSSVEGVAINCKLYIDFICPWDSLTISEWLFNRSFYWIIQGIEQIRGSQVQKPFLQGGNQFQLLPQQQQQQLLAQAQAQGNLGNSVYADMDPRRFGGLPRGNLNAKDGQPIGNDGSIGSPMQSSSSKVRFCSLIIQINCIFSEK